MSRKRENDSSLELLLDTMCNTFGGVMFIAISLAVLIAGRELARAPREEPDRREEAAAIRRQITALEAALARESSETAELQQLQQVLAQDERLKLAAEIAVLEARCRDLELQQQVRLQKNQALRTETAAVRNTAEKIRKQKLAAAAEADKLAAENQQIEAEIRELEKKLRTDLPPELTFHAYEERQETPYFILLKEGRAWLAGPEKHDNDFTPAPDVTMQRQGEVLIFIPRPDRGSPLLAGEALAPELEQLLATASDQGRLPAFVVDRSSAAAFFKVRQLLKQKKIYHGFSVQEKCERFLIKLTSKAKYEY